MIKDIVIAISPRILVIFKTDKINFPNEQRWHERGFMLLSYCTLETNQYKLYSPLLKITWNSVASSLCSCVVFRYAFYIRVKQGYSFKHFLFTRYTKYLSNDVLKNTYFGKREWMQLQTEPDSLKTHSQKEANMFYQPEWLSIQHVYLVLYSSR